ncbi:hypothetical protein RND81_02G225500 [Saponaria officinalis]|uniref:Homeobox-leucine zipper protein n=1 Tax=Saponaria officinalis TaxID=3572 RepID=A0AAW1MNX2_SAPOF
MESGRVYGMFENSNNSTWVPSTSPSFHETMVNFDLESQQGKKLSMTKRDHTDMEDFELINSYQSEKKRRLSTEQVQFLEKSFEVENKLDPDRKMELAEKIGLEPRQVAIWFQNRRARYKTKQLEKEYGSLKANFDQLKFDFDSLSKERDILQNEVKLLTKKLKQRDETNDLTPTNLFHTNTVLPKLEIEKIDQTSLIVIPNTNKQMVEDASSTKSDVFDSESPHCTDGNHSSLIDDPIDQQSDFSPSLPVYNNFLKVEDIGGYDPDDQPFWSMLY